MVSTNFLTVFKKKKKKKHVLWNNLNNLEHDPQALLLVILLQHESN